MNQRDEASLIKEIHKLAIHHSRYGYRRITVLLKRGGLAGKKEKGPPYLEIRRAGITPEKTAETKSGPSRGDSEQGKTPEPCLKLRLC